MQTYPIFLPPFNIYPIFTNYLTGIHLIAKLVIFERRYPRFNKQKSSLYPQSPIFTNRVINKDITNTALPDSADLSSSPITSPASHHWHLNMHHSSAERILFGQTFENLTSQTIASRKLRICYRKLKLIVF